MLSYNSTYFDDRLYEKLSSFKILVLGVIHIALVSCFGLELIIMLPRDRATNISLDLNDGGLSIFVIVLIKVNRLELLRVLRAVIDASASVAHYCSIIN